MSRLFRTSCAAIVLGAVLLALMVGGPAAARSNPRPSPTPTATPTPLPENPAVTIVARREFVAWQAGVLDMTHYAPRTRAKLTPKSVTQISKALGMLGSLIRTKWLYPLAFKDMPPGVHGYLYEMVCSDGVVYEQLTIAPDGEIDGILFRNKPPQ